MQLKWKNSMSWSTDMIKLMTVHPKSRWKKSRTGLWEFTDVCRTRSNLSFPWRCCCVKVIEVLWGFFGKREIRLCCWAAKCGCAPVIRHLKMGSLSSSRRRRRCRPPDWSWRHQTGQIWLRPINPVTKFPAVLLNDDFCPGKMNLCLHSHRH